MRVFEHVLGATEEMPRTDILHAALLNAIKYELSIEKRRGHFGLDQLLITSEACRKDTRALVHPTVRTSDRHWSSVRWGKGLEEDPCNTKSDSKHSVAWECLPSISRKSRT